MTRGSAPSCRKASSVNVNPRIGTLRAMVLGVRVLDEVVAVQAQTRTDASQGVTPEIPGNVLGLTGRDGGRGKRFALRKLDYIGVAVKRVNGPVQGIALVHERSVRSCCAVTDLHGVGICFRTFLDIRPIATTEVDQQRDQK